MTDTNVLVKIYKEGELYKAKDENDKDWSESIPLTDRKTAFDTNRALERQTFGTSEMWIKVPLNRFKRVHMDESNTDIITMIRESAQRKPEKLIISDLKWKLAVRTMLRGGCIMVTGPAGCGKTLLAKCLPEAYNHPFFKFNIGATQDPKSYLVGNSHLKDGMTYFEFAEFVEAIQTENAVILLDELSRGNPEAWNILMPVLDPEQKYLRIDEHPDKPIINVAKGVTFIATANIGTEYTSTRQMDWAMVERFTTVEMDILTKDEEIKLLKFTYPTLNVDDIEHIAEIAELTRNEADGNGSLSTPISTRSTVRVGGLIYDGFSFVEAFEASVYSQYDSDGGTGSERTFFKQAVQKYEPKKQAGGKSANAKSNLNGNSFEEFSN